jgi:hypothetical protein
MPSGAKKRYLNTASPREDALDAAAVPRPRDTAGSGRAFLADALEPVVRDAHPDVPISIALGKPALLKLTGERDIAAEVRAPRALVAPDVRQRCPRLELWPQLRGSIGWTNTRVWTREDCRRDCGGEYEKNYETQQHPLHGPAEAKHLFKYC